jgi:hypothetical protein
MVRAALDGRDQQRAGLCVGRMRQIGVARRRVAEIDGETVRIIAPERLRADVAAEARTQPAVDDLFQRRKLCEHRLPLRLTRFSPELEENAMPYHRNLMPPGCR